MENTLPSPIPGSKLEAVLSQFLEVLRWPGREGLAAAPMELSGHPLFGNLKFGAHLETLHCPEERDKGFQSEDRELKSMGSSC